MKTRLFVIGGAALLTVALVSQLPINDEDGAPEPRAETALGDVQAFESHYKRWAAARSRGGESKSLAMALGYSKALSAKFTRARGLMRIDLVDGAVSVEVSGLEGNQAYDVWLIDNRPGTGRSVRPEAGDEMLRLGSLKPTAAGAGLFASLAEQDLRGFEIDLVAVAEAGQDPQSAGLLFGSPSLLQKLFHHDRDGWYASLSSETAEPGDTARAPLDFLVPSAFAQEASLDIARLVRLGERIFFNERFDGNGRTCGTCHPADNNLTIDPAFIATLPANDPLFVAEFNPALAALERPKLMRELGLILENLDGFPLDPTNPEDTMFTMRGVPHTLALPTSLEPSTGDSSTMPPDQRTGWSGDGAPGAGTLRTFATGAVTQHFPRTLKRAIGVDFRLPTDRELDALEAFQLSLGRQEDIEDLAVVEFLDDRVENGKVVFLNRTPNTPGMGQCNRCHANAGANFGDGTNRNFNTGVEQLTDRTARQVAPGLIVPCDGGFGREKNEDPAICSRVSIDLIGIGDGEFNTPSLIEAADTPPFFHNNSAATIEDAVLFYNGPEFNDSGIGQAIGGIRLTTTEILEVAAMLRVLNALENIGEAIASAKRSVDPAITEGAARDLLRAAIDENRDAIAVLRDSVLNQLHPDARDSLRLATLRLREAIQNSADRIRLVREAVVLQDSARHDMVLVVPRPLG